MKKFIFALLCSQALIAHAQTNHLVISQVYAGGGNTNALYTHDFVELYNPTASAISLAGWSLQYAGATSTSWSNSNKTNLTGSVAPGKYFLIQLDGGPEGKPLPQPDFKVTDVNVNLSSAGGKIVLVKSTAYLSGGCPVSSALVDFLGYKSTSTPNCSETAAAVTATNNVNSISRKNNGCTDTDNNSTDFENTIPSPRNSLSNGHTCTGGSIIVGTTAPNPFCVDAATSTNGTVNFTATGTFNNSPINALLSDAVGSFGYATVVGSVTVSGTNPSGTINITLPANTPSGTGYKIHIESTNPLLTSSNQSNPFEVINGAKNLLQNEFTSAANNTTMTLNWTNPAGCFDEILIVAKAGSSINGTPSGDGTAYTADLNFTGNGTSFDGGKVVYKGTASGQTVRNLAVGTTYYFKAYTQRGTTWSSGTEISDKARVVPLPGEIVINQLSPGYNNALDEYFELVNLTDKPFDMADVAIRVVNGSGATVVAGGTLSGTIQPHSFWLVSPNATLSVGQTNTLSRDNSVDGGFAATSNQIGLVRKTDNASLDAVGYGTVSTPVYTEGTPTSNPPSKGGLKRKISGADNNNNSTDFMSVANADIDLHNSNSRLANAGAIIPAGMYTTLEVTGNATLGGSAAIIGKVIFTNGVFELNGNNISTTKLLNYTPAKYIKTNGAGALTITNVGAETFFPVGNSTYNPVTISNGSNLDWSVRVSDAVEKVRAFSSEYAVQRTWHVTPSASPATGAAIVFEYNDADPAQVGLNFDKTKAVQVWSNHNGIWQPVTESQMPVTTPSGRKSVTLTNYTQFSPFVIVNVNAPLPVHFSDFTAQEQPGGVQLQFTNAVEKDVEHYIIERSADGQLFQTLIQLEPQYNNGSPATYRWLDAAPLPGNAWYRIKGIDRDGTISLTQVRKVTWNRIHKTLTIYPNPVRGRTLIWQAALPKGTYIIQVHNNTGQIVLQQRFEYSGGGIQTLTLPAALPRGVYYLHISNGTVKQQHSFVVFE